MLKKILFILFILCLVSNIQASTYLQQMFSGGYLDNSGDLLSGGQVYVYEANTTTRKASWSQYQGGDINLHDQPIILDSAGRAGIYCTGLYKFVIYDSDGNLVDTWDYVDNNFTTTGSLTLSDGSTTTVSINASVDSYINSGKLGLGLTAPAYSLDISMGSPGIGIRDTTTSEDVRIQNVGGKLKIIDFSGSDVLLWEADIALGEAPTGFYNTPVGTITMYAGATAPDGWVLCNGQTLTLGAPGQKHKALYDVIGTTYGGTGEANFKVPDFRGRYARGEGTDGTTDNLSRGVEPSLETARSQIAFQDTLSGTQSASHTHGLGTLATTTIGSAHTHDLSNTNILSQNGTGYSLTAGNGMLDFNVTATASSTHTHGMTGTLDNQSASHGHNVVIDAGGDSENRPYSEVVNYIIYAGVL